VTEGSEVGRRLSGSEWEENNDMLSYPQAKVSSTWRCLANEKDLFHYILYQKKSTGESRSEKTEKHHDNSKNRQKKS